MRASTDAGSGGRSAALKVAAERPFSARGGLGGRASRGWALLSRSRRGRAAGGMAALRRWSAEFFFHDELGDLSADGRPVPETSDFAADAENLAAVFQAFLQVPFLLGTLQFRRSVAVWTARGDLKRPAAFG